MQFTKIIENNTCDCLSDATENLTDQFVRKVGTSSSIKDRDFKNNFERGKILQDENDCKERCGFHAVSIEIWNDVSSKLLLEKYFTTLGISPKYRNNLCVMKFKSGSGVLKHTPDQIDYNEFHYDLYKEDSFNVENLELVDMIPLKII
jgi:hypothetical protein